MNPEIGLTALLLGVDVAQRLFPQEDCELELHLRSVTPAASPFLQRLREALAQCCRIAGVESIFKHLMLPVAVGDYLLDGSEDERALVGKKLKLVNALLPPEVNPIVNQSEENGEEEVVGVTEETKQKVIRLYHKGIRASYLCELFGIESTRLVHSWGDWAKRPAPEQERNMAKREQIQTLLAQGEQMKAICAEMKLKPKAYRELLGLSTTTVYSRAVYENVMQQMHVITDDEYGGRDAKKLAIELFYETGNSNSAALALKTTPAQVKKWVLDFQHIVDSRH